MANTAIYDEMLRKAKAREKRQSEALENTRAEIKQIEADIKRVLSGK